MSKFKTFEVCFALHGVMTVNVIAEDADEALKEAEEILEITPYDLNIEVLDIIEKKLEAKHECE
jgi:CBS-domain-containing membrane protein